MEYVCPNPQCKAAWTWTETFYRGGTPFQCDSCKSTSTIPLYCPKCCPPQMDKKKYLQTPSGFLGGESYVCPSKHRFTVPVLIGEVHSRLGEWGNEIGQYHQSDRIKTLPGQQLKSLVSGGYCAGVALDWIRRALLGGKLNYTDGKVRQDVRAAIAWTQQTPEKKNAFLQTKYSTLKAGLNQKVQADMKQANLDIEEVTKKANLLFEKIGQATDLSPQQRKAAYEKAQAAYDKAVSAIRAEGDAKEEKYTAAVNTWRSKPVMERFWPEYGGVMDEYLAKDRLKRGKTGPSKRGFSDLTIVKSVNTTEFGGVAALIDALICEPEFKGNRAAYFGINPPLADATGHAIAILRQNTGGSYHLFDPNFGTYELTAQKLREAVVYIFKKAYPNIPSGNNSDNQAYEIGGKVKGEYTIFEGAQKTVSTPVPLLKPATIVKAEQPKVLAPMTTPPKFQQGPANTAKGGGAPVTGQKPVVTTTSTPPKSGGKVSDLISKFNK